MGFADTLISNKKKFEEEFGAQQNMGFADINCKQANDESKYSKYCRHLKYCKQ